MIKSSFYYWEQLLIRAELVGSKVLLNKQVKVLLPTNKNVRKTVFLPASRASPPGLKDMKAVLIRHLSKAISLQAHRKHTVSFTSNTAKKWY